MLFRSAIIEKQKDNSEHQEQFGKIYQLFDNFQRELEQTMPEVVSPFRHFKSFESSARLDNSPGGTIHSVSTIKPYAKPTPHSSI